MLDVCVFLVLFVSCFCVALLFIICWSLSFGVVKCSLFVVCYVLSVYWLWSVALLLFARCCSMVVVRHIRLLLFGLDCLCWCFRFVACCCFLRVVCCLLVVVSCLLLLFVRGLASLVVGCIGCCLVLLLFGVVVAYC